MYCAVKVAAYRQEFTISLGLDNDAACAGVTHMRSATCRLIQQHILRKIFWLKAWANIDIACFLVASAQNPADSLSRIHEFPTHVRAVKDTEPLGVHGRVQAYRFLTFQRSQSIHISMGCRCTDDLGSSCKQGE